MQNKKKNISSAQAYLTILYVVALLISNIISSRQVLLPFDITMTGAVLVFPITYILSDLFSEVYGYGWSRKTCYLGFAGNLLAVVVFSVVIALPWPGYWQDSAAYETVLGNTPRMLFASLAGFVVGDFANDKIFQKMKMRCEGMKGFKSRAILSSLAGEAIDSLIFIPVAFLGQMPLKQMIVMGITQIALKVGYETLIVPVTALCCRKIKEYEEKEE